MYFYGSAKNPPRGPLGATTAPMVTGPSCSCHTHTLPSPTGLGDDSTFTSTLVIGGLALAGLLYLMKKL